MIETVWQCPLCESDPTHHHYFDRVIGKLWEGQYKFQPVFYAICDVCGLVFQWQRMDEDMTYEFYTSQYRATIQGGNDGVTERVLTEQQRRVDYLMPELDLETVGNVLDVGSSTGLWLNALLEKYDCGVAGVEPGEKFRMYALNKFKIKTNSELDMLNHDKYKNIFDLITCIHTLEHFTEPKKILLRLHDFITDNGHLLIEVPNMYGENCLSLNHPIVFTVETITEMLARTGWEVVWIKEYYGFKEGYPTIPNILVMARPGRLTENLMYVEIEDIKAKYNDTQFTLMEFYEQQQWSPPRNVGQVYRGKGTAGGKN